MNYKTNIGWDEEHCALYDAIATEDHSEIATAAERIRRENAWVLVLNSSGPNGQMNQREDHHEAIKIKERYTKSLAKVTRLHPSDQVRQRPGQPFAWYSEGTGRVDTCNLIKLIFVVWKSSEKWWQVWSWEEQ